MFICCSHIRNNAYVNLIERKEKMMRGRRGEEESRMRKKQKCGKSALFSSCVRRENIKTRALLTGIIEMEDIAARFRKE